MIADIAALIISVLNDKVFKLYEENEYGTPDYTIKELNDITLRYIVSAIINDNDFIIIGDNLSTFLIPIDKFEYVIVSVLKLSIERSKAYTISDSTKTYSHGDWFDEFTNRFIKTV